jgi:hypothetical protein
MARRDELNRASESSDQADDCDGDDDESDEGKRKKKKGGRNLTDDEVFGKLYYASYKAEVDQKWAAMQDKDASEELKKEFKKYKNNRLLFSNSERRRRWAIATQEQKDAVEFWRERDLELVKVFAEFPGLENLARTNNPEYTQALKQVKRHM